MKTVTHEMRHQLAVAVAYVEACIDGKLEPTPQRLRAISQALGKLEVLIENVNMRQPQTLPSESHMVDICSIVGDEVLAIEAAVYSHAENRLNADDPIRIGQAVKNLLLSAMRNAPPGGAVAVDCRREAANFVFSVSNEGTTTGAASVPHVFASGLPAALPGHGETITVESHASDGVTFTVRLPDAASTLTRAAFAPQVPFALVAARSESP